MQLSQLLPGYSDREDPEVIALSLDSRQVQPGTLFFAIPGVEQDGRLYIEEAIRRGAAVVLFEADGYDNFPSIQRSDLVVCPVADLSKQVGSIVARFYSSPSTHMTVIAVTGTNGKTSITHFLADAYHYLHVPCGIIGTLGNGWRGQLIATDHTTPDPITLQASFADLRDNGIHTVAIEASSHALAQHRLAGVAINTAVFSNLTQDHLDYHHTMAEYAAAKARLFAWPNLLHAVVNLDDEYGQRLLSLCDSRITRVTYSLNGRQHVGLPFVCATDVQLTPAGYRLVVESSWGGAVLAGSLCGGFNASNILAVLAVLLVHGVSMADAVSACASVQAVEGRMQVMNFPGAPIVVVDYAHTPDALTKVLSTLQSYCTGQLWCVFGCGGERDRKKRPMMARAAAVYADHIVVTSDNPRSECPQDIISDIVAGFSSDVTVMVIEDRAEAIAHAIRSSQAGDIVLLAGKGHEKVQLIGQNVHPFSDWDCAQKVLLSHSSHRTY